MNRKIFLFVSGLLVVPWVHAKDSGTNHFGFEMLLGQHSQAGPVDDLKTHRQTVQADPATSDHQFSQESNLSFGAAAIYERALSTKNRIGVRLAWESVGLGNLQETSVETDGIFTGNVTRKYSVNGSQRALSFYYRRFFLEKVKLSPFVGAGVSHFRAVANVEESSSIFLSSQDLFSESYNPIERWIPHLIGGVDVFGAEIYGLNVGVGLSIEYLWNARFSGFHNASQELAMVNGQLTSVPRGSGGEAFKADFGGFLYGLSFKVMY